MIQPRAGATEEQGCARITESRRLGPALPRTQHDSGRAEAFKLSEAGFQTARGGTVAVFTAFTKIPEPQPVTS